MVFVLIHETYTSFARLSSLIFIVFQGHVSESTSVLKIFFLNNFSIRKLCKTIVVYKKIFKNSKIFLSGLLHYNENPIHVFPEKELHGLSPNFHIHVSVSDVCIPGIGPHTVFSCSRIG